MPWNCPVGYTRRDDDGHLRLPWQAGAHVVRVHPGRVADTFSDQPSQRNSFATPALNRASLSSISAPGPAASPPSSRVSQDA
jgi:hypothetical protein